MSHAITRTSPKGGPFIGRCIKCGEEGLGMGAPLEACPADGIVSDEQALMEMLEAPTFDMSIHHNPDAAAWAALFKSKFPDSDEGLMLGWFANAMMAMYDHTVNTRTDLSQASVAAALEAAAVKSDDMATEWGKKRAAAWRKKNATEEARVFDGMSLAALTVADAILALITPDAMAALEAERAKARKVKPLVWERDRVNGEEIARSMVGTYVVTKHSWGRATDRNATQSDNPKAAAQADYEARILAALDKP